MKKILTKLLASIIATTMVLSLSACGSKKTADNSNGTDKKVKLKVYLDYSDEDTKVPYDYAVAALKKEMPNVELELEPASRDDGMKLKTYATSGNMPDIFMASLEQINMFKKANIILELDKYANDFKSKMQPNAMNTLINADGHIYTFPVAGNEYVLLYYNKEIFEKNGVKVPTTYDELLTAVKTFNSKGVVPLSIFAKEKWPCVALYDVFATRSDAEGIVKLDKNKGKASDEAYKVAAERVVELVKAGLLPKGATNLNYDQAAALFHEGKAAMFINGQWEIEASTKALGDKVDWMYYPAYDTASIEKTKYAFSGGAAPGGLAVSANTKDKELTTKVAAFLSLKYAECKVTTRANPLVATKVDAPVQKPFPPMMDKLSKIIPNITSTTGFDWHLSNPKFKAGLEDNTQKLLTGSYSAKDFVSDMDKVIEEANK